MADIKIWDGAASWNTDSSAENTPFGLYDSDNIFTGSAVSTAKWCAKRLGYPIVDIELQSGSFFACFEEAVTEYSSQVNRFNIKENLLFLKGNNTGSSYTHVNVKPNLGRSIEISKQYGAEAGVGGDVTWYSGSVAVSSGSGQEYDLDALWGAVSESGKTMEIKRVFYQASPAITRFFDPYVGTGTATSQLLGSFGWQNASPAVYYLMMPMYDDMLRMQAIEFNDVVRKSAYSFELINNKLRIFPKPTNSSPYNLYFQYILTEDRSQPYKNRASASAEVSDFSNVPYDNMTYNQINDPGKQWIRKYTLALSKELLGGIRSKYSAVPIPGGDVTVDGDTLRTEAASEKEVLISQLREDLEQASRRNMLERQKEESEFQRETINHVPLNIYIG